MKKDATPVQHAPRSVPVKIQLAYKKELTRLMQLGIIKKENEDTDRVNSIMPVIKANGDLHLCMDPKDLNCDLERNPHWITSMEI